MKTTKTLFAACVWGKKYIDTFCTLILPTHLAQLNIPTIKTTSECEYLFLTHADDLDYIKDKEIINHLSTVLPVRFLSFQSSAGEKYGTVSYLQSASFRYAHHFSFDFVFPLYADVICSNNTLSTAYNKLVEGFKAVTSLGPQTVEENIGPVLKRLKTNFQINITGRELVRETFAAIHPFHAPSFWREGEFTNTPSIIFFDAPDNDVIAHGFHLHPIALKTPQNPLLLKPFYGTLDEHFLSHAIDTIDDIYVVQDSDDAFMCSTESLQDSQRHRQVDGARSISKIARYAERHTSVLQRALFRIPIRMHDSDVKLTSAEKSFLDAREVVDRVLHRLYTPDSVLALEDPVAFNARKYHAEQLTNFQKQLLAPPKNSDSIIQIKEDMFIFESDATSSHERSLRLQMARVRQSIVFAYFIYRLLIWFAIHTKILPLLISYKNKLKSPENNRRKKTFFKFGVTRKILKFINYAKNGSEGNSFLRTLSIRRLFAFWFKLIFRIS